MEKKQKNTDKISRCIKVGPQAICPQNLFMDKKRKKIGVENVSLGLEKH